MIGKLLEPVLNEKKEPCWLIFKGTEMISNKTTKTSIKEIIAKDDLLEEKKIFILEPEGKWECNKCGAITNFVGDGKPIICPECDRTSDFKEITPVITGDVENLWKLTIWMDIAKEDLNMLEVFDNLVELLKKCIILPGEEYYTIFALWIVASYHIDIFESVGWLQFVGIHDSGKTRAIDIISELGYRMVHGGSGVTFPAMVRASHFYKTGILLDQAEKKLSETTETGREMLGFILPSYRRRSKYVVADKEDPKKTIAYNNFGMKAFASERGFNEALTSRCIQFQMDRDFPEIAKLSTVQQEFNDIQTKLLNYKYKFDTPASLENNIVLRGRIREIFEPILTVGKHIGVDISKIIEFAKDMEKDKEDELQSTVEWSILKAIKGSQENEKLFDAPEEISFEDICGTIDWEYPKKSQKLGYIFNKKLLLKTKRKANGTVLLLGNEKNQRRLKALYRRYKV